MEVQTSRSGQFQRVKIRRRGHERIINLVGWGKEEQAENTLPKGSVLKCLVPTTGFWSLNAFWAWQVGKSDSQCAGILFTFLSGEEPTGNVLERGSKTNTQTGGDWRKRLYGIRQKRFVHFQLSQLVSVQGCQTVFHCVSFSFFTPHQGKWVFSFR